MIVMTDEGLLRVDMTLDEFVKRNLQPDTVIDTWYCPFGSHNPEWFMRKMLFIKTVMEESPDEFKEFHQRAVLNGDLPRLGPILGAPNLAREVERGWESIVWERMKSYFYGPIAGCPGPNIKEAIADKYAQWLMYRLTKHGDMPEGVISCEYIDEERAKLLKAEPWLPDFVLSLQMMKIDPEKNPGRWKVAQLNHRFAAAGGCGNPECGCGDHFKEGGHLWSIE